MRSAQRAVLLRCHTGRRRRGHVRGHAPHAHVHHAHDRVRHGRDHRDYAGVHHDRDHVPRDHRDYAGVHHDRDHDDARSQVPASLPSCFVVFELMKESPRIYYNTTHVHHGEIDAKCRTLLH